MVDKNQGHIYFANEYPTFAMTMLIVWQKLRILRQNYQNRRQNLSTLMKNMQISGQNMQTLKIFSTLL